MVWRIVLSAFLFSALSVSASNGRILKVLPQLLDLRGRNALNPSLYERDAYQVYLRQHPEEVSALRFEVQYKTSEIKGPLTLRLELRGSKTGILDRHIFETEVKPSGFFSKWGRIQLERATSEEVGSLVAWKASLLKDGIIVAEQESFLW